MNSGHLAVELGGAAALRPLREQFQEWLLARSEVDAQRLDDLSVALTEVATNALEAAEGAAVDVSCHLVARVLTIRVVNPNPRGAGVQLRTAPQAPHEPRGRGLYLVQLLVDEIDVTQVDGTVDITIRTRI